MDESKENLIITSDHKFNLMNENHLFEAMGLTQTNEGELEQIFSKEINEYLKSTLFI